MNPRTFLQEMEQSRFRDRLVSAAYEEFLAFGQDEGITVDDISHEEMEALAEGFVTRGFGLPESDATSRENFRHLSAKELAFLKKMGTEPEEYS